MWREVLVWSVEVEGAWVGVRGTGTGTFPFSTLKACAFKKLLLLLPTCHLLRASDNYTTTLSIYIQDPS